MLEQQPWMKGLWDIRFELMQAEEEGKDIASVLEEARRLMDGARNPALYAEADVLYQRIQALPLRKGYPYVEPSDLAGIRAQRGATAPLPALDLDGDALFDRILGAWQARCAGCLLGQPVEGWRRERIRGLLRDTGNWPVSRYLSSDIPSALREKYDVTDEGGPYGSKVKNWINNVDGMPEDDDTSYTVFALKLLEFHGRDFTSGNVGEEWLSSMPMLRTCTAERVAYLNMANLVLPPHSATRSNPYREWIGAQIRADLFGYVNPGAPETAAEMAFRDASISHVKNGIYGEMYAAAMIAAAFATDDPGLIVEAGLVQIPAKSRLHEQVRALLAGWRAGVSLDAWLEAFFARYDEANPHHWCHTIPNALLVTAGLLYCNMEFVPAIALGVTSGFDTDCNAATIGSIIGAAKGAKALPEAWIAPLRDKVRTCVAGSGEMSITPLAKRTQMQATR